jgi:CIC family chloride channel protein
MGTFYGGIAHVPVSSLILVSELAGSYDLLVPLMLAEGISFVALRRRSLYEAQVAGQSTSPAHTVVTRADVLRERRVRDAATARDDFVRFGPGTPAREMVRQLGEATWQDVFPVLGESGGLAGLVTGDALRLLTAQTEALPWTIAADIMLPPISIDPDSDLRTAAELMLSSSLRELPVRDPESGRIVAFLDEADISRAYLSATGAATGAAGGRPDLPGDADAGVS